MSIQMKRSAINAIMRESEAFMRSFGFILPPFSRWSPDEMRARKGEIDGITGASLGWDITDFGLGDFEQTGLFLFTVRNGRFADLQRGRGMLYAEKAMIARKDQVTPMHRHLLKAEDIINRGRRHAGDRAVWRYRRPVRPVQGHTGGDRRHLARAGTGA